MGLGRRNKKGEEQPRSQGFSILVAGGKAQGTRLGEKEMRKKERRRGKRRKNIKRRGGDK